MMPPKLKQYNTTHSSQGTIKILNDNDVLCGRGSGPNDHIGNIAFRELVSTRRKEYLNTTSRSQKARIAKEIAAVVRNLNPPGRFLEKATDTSWQIVTEGKALEKVKQALRQMRHRRSMMMKSNSYPEKHGKAPCLRRNSAPPIFGSNRYQTLHRENVSADDVYSNNFSIQRIPNDVNSHDGELQTLTFDSSRSIFKNGIIPNNAYSSHAHGVNSLNIGDVINLSGNTDFDYNNTLYNSTISQVDLEPEPIHVCSNGDVKFRKHIGTEKYEKSGQKLNEIEKIYQDISSNVSDHSITSIESEIDPQPFSFDQHAEPLDDEATAQEYLKVVLALEDVQSSFSDIA